MSVMGLSFKENCPDLRNSRVIDIVRELRDYGTEVQVCDPSADAGDAVREYGIELVPLERLKPAHAVVFAVAHSCFAALNGLELSRLFGERCSVIDVKGLLPRVSIEELGCSYWRL